jgi:GNAT superfamily N-acetyltransferase
MAVKVVPVEISSAQICGFYGLPGKIYGDDPFYCEPFEDSVKKSVEREFFRDRQKIFLGYEGKNAVARLIARISPDLKDERRRPIGMIGFFESFDKAEAVELILKEAVVWLKNAGAGEIIGPIDGDTWRRYRFNIGPFDTRPFMMEPYNPAYYPALWEKNGFELLSYYYSKHVPDSAQAADKTEKFMKRTEKTGFTFRNFRADNFEGEMKILYDLSCAIFSDNYLYTKISESDFMEMYSGTKSILNPELIWFAQDKNGKYAGFVFSFPDYFEAISAMKGKKGIISKLKFLLNKPAADTLNVKTLGSIPEYRGAGLGMALMHKAYTSGLSAGFRKVNLCLIREGNSSGRVDMDSGYVSRKYNLYQMKAG